MTEEKRTKTIAAGFPQTFSLIAVTSGLITLVSQFLAEKVTSALAIISFALLLLMALREFLKYWIPKHNTPNRNVLHMPKQRHFGFDNLQKLLPFLYALINVMITFGLGALIALGFMPYIQKNLSGKTSLSAEAQDILRVIAMLGGDSKPGAYFYFGSLETKSREIITYNNALVFPHAYSAVVLEEDAPKKKTFPAIYCGDARNSLEKTMNELLKADALKISESHFFSEPSEFTSDDFSSRPIWYALTPKGKEIYEAINKREKQIFRVKILRRDFHSTNITDATVVYELRDGVVQKCEVSGALVCPNDINTANTLPMIVCESISPDADEVLLTPEME